MRLRQLSTGNFEHKERGSFTPNELEHTVNHKITCDLPLTVLRLSIYESTGLSRFEYKSRKARLL